MPETIAVVADIHGNRWALEAVLDDIRKRRITTVLNLGDSLYGPLDPMGTYSLIRDHGLFSISGNEDRLLVEHARSRRTHKTMDYVLTQINHDILSWLESLPFDHVSNNLVYCCHGTPEHDTEYLIEDVRSGFPLVKDSASLSSHLNSIFPPVVCCGHSHLPHVVQTDQCLIINPGSVGCPAYDDNTPVYHRMETGSPRARYSVLTLDPSGVKTSHVTLEYDAEGAARTAEKNGHDNWAFWLRTGRVSP